MSPKTCRDDVHACARPAVGLSREESAQRNRGRHLRVGPAFIASSFPSFDPDVLSSGPWGTVMLIESTPVDFHQANFHLTSPPAARTQMRVTKRNGDHEPVDVNKIVRAVARCADELSAVDPMRVAL